jgi:hypothetical protein
MKIKNRIFAIEAAPAAIPPKPNIAAIIATTKNMTVQRNIINDFSYIKDENSCTIKIEKFMPQNFKRFSL